MRKLMIGHCKFCHRFKFNLIEKTVPSGPGVGRIHRICPKCLAAERLPESWYKRMGIRNPTSDSAKFVRYVGIPHVTASEYGQNAFGSVLAEYDDGSRVGVICGHGGSEWLCLSCAEKLVV